MRPASGNRGEHQLAQEKADERIEFGFTHEELLRYLPSALEHFRHRIDGTSIAVEVGGGRICMELGAPAFAPYRPAESAGNPDHLFFRVRERD